MRELSRGGRRKNDVIDAAAAASVAALAGDATPIPVEDLSTVLALLDERRANLAAHRTRLVNQLHALLRDLVPGGADTDLTATTAARVLAAVRPVGPVEAARKQLARDLVAEVREVDARLAKLSTQMSKTVAEHGSRLPEVDGIGPVVAARLLGRTGRAGRFPTASAFASYAGVAPVEVASADRARHRLPRGGDRQLNLALHIVALTQVRMRRQHWPRLLRPQDRRGQDPQRGHALPQAPSRRPRLANHDRRRATEGGGPGRTIGGDSDIQRGWLNPDHQLFGQVTSRARRSPAYDLGSGRLTNTEEPRGSLSRTRTTHRMQQQERIRLHHVSDSCAAPRGEPHLEPGDARLGFPRRTRQLGQL